MDKELQPTPAVVWFFVPSNMSFLSNIFSWNTKQNEEKKQDEETRQRLTNLLGFLATRNDNDEKEELLTREQFLEQPALAQNSKHVSFYAKGSASWMRIKRPTSLPSQFVPTDPHVRHYFQEYLGDLGLTSIRDLTLQHIRNAPHTNHSAVKSFLRRLHKRFLVQKTIDPLYDRLLGIGQQEQLYWGFGSYKNQHVLQVAMEVNWQKDGSLLLQPKVHLGVRFNPAVIKDLPQDLRREQYDCSSISPASQNTFQPILEACGLAEVNTTTWSVFVKDPPVSAAARDASRWVDVCREGQLPLAVRALTHGAGDLPSLPAIHSPVHFPLPTSHAQMQIAKLLFNGSPAVVCEGPPGTGKTSSIANIVCAYLCQGKRVLVTSKGAPALSVLRSRLPEALQSLCVDVSMSESSGLRQLQTTVERLVDKVAMTTANKERHELLENAIKNIEEKIHELDEHMLSSTNDIRKLLDNDDGKVLMDLTTSLLQESPWILEATKKWSVHEIRKFRLKLESLAKEKHPDVTGFVAPPSDLLISFVASEAGRHISSIKLGARSIMSSIPVLGNLTGVALSDDQAREELANLKLRERSPATKHEWEYVLRALEYSRDLHLLQETWSENHRLRDWPMIDFLGDAQTELRRAHEIFEKVEKKRSIEILLRVNDFLKDLPESESISVRRKTLTNQLQQLRKELAEASVISVLSESFSPESQSALIKFAQIAAQAKFTKVTQVNRMTKRQQRKREEYLDAFDQCCRFIPCWIMTSTQISDFLPPECLFDLVVIDEASQSDSSVLPGMLRGKQWLVVGDSKQVSPTEAFVSEEQIENLQASLPESPLADALLPGQSFFDMSSRAFPRHRVVLEEHFRCAEDIILFSNENFYDRRLIPLRMPTQSERLTPTLIDVFLGTGVKVGKTNEQEADEIVNMIQNEISRELEAGTSPRSIGVISLMGDEQSRLIRGRLLDRVGAEAMARHDILIGDSPTFQGAERDIIFLTMVCSPTNCPVQTQLTHWQRANVAMSRARDRCVLVRSVREVDVTAQDDIKTAIIRFFQNASMRNEDGCLQNEVNESLSISSLLVQNLRERGYSVGEMNEMIRAACIFVEDRETDTRVAITIDCTGEDEDVWLFHYERQKAIQRVGWQCLRVNSLSLICDFQGSIEKLEEKIAAYGISRKSIANHEQDVNSEAEGGHDDTDEIGEDEQMLEIEGIDEVEFIEPPSEDKDVITLSSDEQSDKKLPAKVKVERQDPPSEDEAGKYGEVVEMDIPDEAIFRPETATGVRSSRRRAAEDDLSSASSKRQRSTYRRLDKYSRDGRWYPDSEKSKEDPEWFDYDTDSDLNPEE